MNVVFPILAILWNALLNPEIANVWPIWLTNVAILYDSNNTYTFVSECVRKKGYKQTTANSTNTRNYTKNCKGWFALEITQNNQLERGGKQWEAK